MKKSDRSIIERRFSDNIQGAMFQPDRLLSERSHKCSVNNEAKMSSDTKLLHFDCIIYHFLFTFSVGKSSLL